MNPQKGKIRDAQFFRKMIMLANACFVQFFKRIPKI